MSPAAAVNEVALRHLDSAYRLGRWLLGDEHEAADAVHDAFVRATRSAHTYAGGNARAWWLAIVRNCCLARLAARRAEQGHLPIDEVAAQLPGAEANAPERSAEALERRALLAHHLQALPVEFREVLLLREIEELSYREIGDVAQIPIGTVMSRLARGRALLLQALQPPAPREGAASEVPDAL